MRAAKANPSDVRPWSRRCVAPGLRRIAFACAAAMMTMGVPLHSATAQAENGAALVMPRIGSRIRLQSHLGGVLPPKRVTGNFVSLQSDSIRLVQLSGDTSAFAVSSLDYLHVSLGRHRRVLASIGAGTLIGGSSLALLSAISHSECDPGECGFIYFTRGEAALLGGILGALSGAVVGGIVGAVRTSDHWQRVPIGQLAERIAVRPHVGTTPGVVVRLPF